MTLINRDKKRLLKKLEELYTTVYEMYYYTDYVSFNTKIRFELYKNCTNS